MISELLGNRQYRHRAEKTKKVRLREQEEVEAKKEIREAFKEDSLD